ncbi:FDXHR family putative zinc-binding protein [Frankia gtarii]|uniref:FDXHR family putative zinc-binding protein n=1 Tax=Frankia gtarii TaxID=2950102 RepID=UPI003F68443F
MPPRRSTSPRAIPAAVSSPRRPRAISVTLHPDPDQSSRQPTLPIQVPRRRQPEAGAHSAVTASCAGCDARWTDPATTHCGSCHQSWPSVQGFDDHLVECPAHPVIAARRVKREPEQSGVGAA